MKKFFSKIIHMKSYLLVITSLFFLASCGGGGSTGTDNPGGGGITETKTLISLSVTAQSSIITVGDSVQYTAIATYSDSTTKNVTGSALWTSSDTTVATVNASGLAQGIGAGQANITASYQDSYGSSVGASTITVSAAPVSFTSVAITPATVTIPVGIYQQLKLIGTLADGTTVDLSVDSNTKWSSSDASIASVKESQSNGMVLAIGNSAGSTNINAVYTDLQGKSYNASVPVTVNNATINSIVIIGDTSITSGESAIFMANGVFSDGNTYPLSGLKSINWTSSNESVISIGERTGLAVGGDSFYTGQNAIIGVSYTDKQGNFESASTSVTLAAPGAPWSSEIDTGFKSSQGFALAVDSNDNLILFFSDAESGNKPTVFQYNGTQWLPLASATNGQVSTTSASSSPAMVVDHLESHDIVYAFYADSASSNHITAQKLDTESPVWNLMQRGFDNGDGGYSMSSLTAALDASRNPWIGFHEHKDGSTAYNGVARWVGSFFDRYGSTNHVNSGNASNAKYLGLAISSLSNSSSDPYLGYGYPAGNIWISHNPDGKNWSSYTLAGSSSFPSTAGFYTESRIYTTYQQQNGGASLIKLNLANFDRSVLAFFTLNTNSFIAQNNLALGEQDTDKPVVAYIDENGNVKAKYYDPTPNVQSMNYVGANPIATPVNNNQFSNPKVVIGKNVAWVAYLDINGQIIVKKLANPFNK